jgi:DNA-binding Xre family transcriptional regulator
MAQRGLTDMALSQMAGLHPATVRLMANDLLRNYDFGVLDRLCAALKLGSLEELLDTGGVLAWQPDETSKNREGVR